MKNLKLRISALAVLAIILAAPIQTMAQWHIGLSYQIRDKVPENGFGVRIERSLLGKLPLIDLRLRAHFAYFNEQNDISGEGLTFGEVTYYDYGLAGVAGVSLGFLKPYAGLGIGASTIDAVIDGSDTSESAFLWSGFVGLEVTPIPKLNPFIEYRFQPVEEAGDAFDDAFENAFNSDGRLIIGLSISF